MKGEEEEEEKCVSKREPLLVYLYERECGFRHQMLPKRPGT
jgi:hypothetical protein